MSDDAWWRGLLADPEGAAEALADPAARAA